MFTKHKIDKVFTLYAVGQLVALFLSIHLLTAQMASGKDIAADNHTNAADAGGKYPRYGDSSLYHSMPAPLRQRMEKERDTLLSRDEYLHSLCKNGKKPRGGNRQKSIIP